MKQTVPSNRLLLLALATMTMALGCTAKSASEADQEPSQGAQESVGDGVSEDFSSPNAGWTVHPRDQGHWSAVIEDGVYLLTADNDQQQYVGAQGYATGEYGDVSLEISAELRSSTEDTPVGLRCRKSGRNVLFADSDREGEVRIGLYVDGNQEILAKSDGAPVLHEGSNRLRLDCVGDRVTFSINDQQVAEAENKRLLAPGAVGVSAGGSGSGVAIVAFDDAVIRTAPPFP